jgi:hypothetical protein
MMLIKEFDERKTRAYSQSVILTVKSPGTFHRSKYKVPGHVRITVAVVPG